MSAGHWRAIIAAWLVFASGPSWAAAGEHHGGTVSADVTALYNSNVTRAERDSDIADDSALEGTVSYSRSTEGLAGRSWSWTLSAKGAKFAEYEDLDHAEVGAELGYRVQFARGFGAPVYEATLSVKALDYVSEIRDGWQAELGGLITKRLTDRIVSRAGFRLTRREATDYEVFDLRRGNVFVNGDWMADRKSVVYGTWIFSTGDVVSTAVPTLDIVDAAEKIEPDDAFGGVPANRFAYRLNADVHIVTLGYNRSLGPSSSLDLSLEGLYAQADGGNEYRRAITRISYLRRF